MHDIAQKQIFFFLTTKAGSGSGFGGELSGSGSGKKVRIRPDPDPDSDPQHCAEDQVERRYGDRLAGKRRYLQGHNTSQARDDRGGWGTCTVIR